MKTKKQLWHGIMTFLQRELEASIAVLVILAFVFGYAYANETTTALDAGNTEAEQVITVSDGFMVDGVKYSGLNFKAGNVAGQYRIRRGFDKGDIIQTIDGTRGATPGATYTWKLTLSQPINATGYVHGTYNQAIKVNGKSVTNATTPISLTGSTITMIFPGGDGVVISALSKTPGALGDSVSSADVKELYILPASARMTVGATRFLQVVALDASGRSVSPKVRWSISKGSEYGVINPTTGELTATKQGVITVQVAVDSKVASATITVQADSATALQQVMNQITARTQTQEQAKTQTESKITTGGETQYPGSDEDQTLKTENLERDDVVSKNRQAAGAAIELFAQEQTATRLQSIGKSNPTQAQINAVVVTRTTLVEKAAVRLTAAVQEIGTTIKQIFAGQTVQNEAGETYRIKSVAQHLGDFIRRLFFGGTATETEPGAGAADEILRADWEEGGEVN